MGQKPKLVDTLITPPGKRGLNRSTFALGFFAGFLTATLIAALVALALLLVVK